MIKEFSLAIFFGLLIGLGLTGTFYFLKQNQNRSLNNNQVLITTPTPNISNKLSPSPAGSNTASNSTFSITSHQNNDIVSTSKITLKGQSNSPNSNLITTTLTKNYYTNTAADGSFSQDIDLDPGLNDIQLTLIASNDQEIRFELFITYSTAKLE